jgi:putative membrane protein
MYRCTTLFALAAGIVGFALTCPTWADDTKDKSDNKFVMEAASGGMLEVKLGKLASDRAANADVRKFGERMVTDHTKANKDLMAVAEKKGIKLPTELLKKHQEALDKFKDLKGAEFDRTYMTSMVKDHEEDVEEFTKEAKDGHDDDVKAFATRTLPVIKEHLRLAKDISAKLDGKDK